MYASSNISSRFNKTIAIITTIAFIFSNTAYAAPSSRSFLKNKKVDYEKLSTQSEKRLEQKKSIFQEGDDRKEERKAQARRILQIHLEDLSQIHIPSELGRVIEVYQATSDRQEATRPLIVHIQDLHTNPEAQYNEADILEILIRDYNMDLVCSEGADGIVDTSSVSSFPDAEVRQKTARLFVNSGELTAEEYLSITKYPDLPIWGIEDRDIYFQNIIEFNKIMKFNPQSQVFISQAKEALGKLKPKIYSSELLAIDQKEIDYENEKIETEDYLKYLTSYIQKFSIPTSNYRNISILDEATQQEKTIDQQKIMQESQNLLLNLQADLAKEGVRSDMDSLMVKAGLFKDQKISPFSFYSYLKDLALRHIPDGVSKYPDLNNFIDYLTKVNSLDSTKIFVEMEDLTYEIKQRLAKNDDQRNLVKALRNIKFLESFFNLKVSNEELDYYLANKDSHKVSWFKDIITSLTPRQGSGQASKTSQTNYIDYNPDLIDAHLQELEDFYKTVKDRDVAMVRNSISEIEKRNIKVAALISGGFHTKGITRMLKEQGYSYIVVSPYSSTGIDEENYHYLLSGQRKPIAELLKQLDLQEITNRLSGGLRVPIGLDEDLIEAFNQSAAPDIARLSGLPLERITAASILHRISLALRLGRGADRWPGQPLVIQLSFPEQGVIIVRYGEGDYIKITASDVTAATGDEFEVAGEKRQLTITPPLITDAGRSVASINTSGDRTNLASNTTIAEALSREAVPAIARLTRGGTQAPDSGKTLASNEGMVAGRVDLKKGPADTNWWAEATMAELAKNPTPWGDDPIVSVERKKGVLEVTLTAKMFEKWSPENPEGRDLDSSTNKYDEIGPLAIAGIRHVMNIANVHDTRQVKNSVERLLTTVALGLMIKMKYNKGAGFPFLTNYGHEVRYNSKEFQDITTRTLAAMGFVCNVVPGNVPIAIWDTSTMGKMFDMPLSFCGTASHSPSSVDGLKIMDYEGSQFLISDIQALIAIKKAIVQHIKEKGSFTFTLAAEDDPRVTDQLYRSTDNGMAVYKEYQEKTAADELILGLIRTLDPSRVHIDCMHGSGYRTLKAFFKKMGLNDVTDKIDWMHTEERPDFGNIGKVYEDPRTGKSKLFDLGADGTQMMERVMPDGTIVKYFPVLCTADYPERLARMPIGDIILPTDLDNDRLFYIQIMANDDATKKLLDETGVVYNVVNAEKIAAVHIPNKSFHLLQDMNLQRIVALMKQGKMDKNRTVVILKTLASTPAVDQWAEKKAAELEKEGIKLRVINTAVGFAKLANVMYRTEGDMRAHPGKDVVISDAAGKDINIGADPIILAAWEESGGIIVGATEKISDLLGNSFLAMREKSATESIFLSLALISKLQRDKGEVNFAEYLKEIYDESGVTTPKDLRCDNALYVPAATRESALEEIAGNERKNRIFGAYLSIVIAKMQNQLSIEEAKKILKDMFNQEYEARKTQAQLSPVLVDRFNKVNFDFLKDIWFTGDGVMFVFEDKGKQWFILFRPSGTEPKLKSYGFGDDVERLTIDAWDFGFNENTAGRLPESFTNNTALMELWGSDGVKAVDKGRRMQQAWEDFGLVVDPQELGPKELGQLETRRLVRKFSPPDNHLELVNQWLRDRGLPIVDIDFSKPQAMPQEAIAELL